MYDKKDLNRETYDITASWAGPNMQNGGIKKKNSVPPHMWNKNLLSDSIVYFKKN